MKDEQKDCDHWCGDHKCHTLVAIIIVGVLLLAVGQFVIYRNIMTAKSMLAEGLMQMKEMRFENQAKKDGYFMSGGKMMMRRGGKESMMEDDATMPNGMKLMMGGQIVRPDKSKTMMKEGGFMDMMGNMMEEIK